MALVKLFIGLYLLSLAILLVAYTGFRNKYLNNESTAEQRDKARVPVLISFFTVLALGVVLLGYFVYLGFSGGVN